MIERLLRAVASIWAPALVAAGPIVVLIAILGIYNLVGSNLLGPTLIGVLSIFIAGFVLLAEKTGYARNFEGQSSPLTLNRVAWLIIPIAALLAITYVTLYVWKP